MSSLLKWRARVGTGKARRSEEQVRELHFKKKFKIELLGEGMFKVSRDRCEELKANKVTRLFRPVRQTRTKKRRSSLATPVRSWRSPRRRVRETAW